MSEEDASEKSHEPSQKKLDDARKKGDVPKSVDLTTAAAYGGLLIAAMVFGATSITDLGSALMSLHDRSAEIAAEIFDGGAPFQGELTRQVAASMAPWFGIPAILALLSVIVQKGLVFAPVKLQPKLSRISPISTAKQKFGRSGLFEFFKSFLKLSIYSVVLFIFLSTKLPRIMATMSLEPTLVVAELSRLTLELMLIVLVVAIAIGGLDALFQHAEHIRKNRMSRKEMTDEHKQSDGDPAMKQQRRDRAVQIAMNQMLADVPDASIVIVNPTHFAVALKWDRMSPGAPLCVAKGVDEVALTIRRIAVENGVPIHSDPPTARALFADVEIGAEIHPDHYRAVAAAIRFAEKIRQRAGRT
ncbi:EscU/YscU/HrcU family type III secretion system export apparatus switch protein [Roseisalinus antarcticus]|uniref:Flagellar biosynthetic protein FlhB n=1 Tax=Roseisalinus antarcticus TaxID=254357 RepID=A0A1Y5TF16_9RHOB|nr:flagellar type III secretion system protein FlhB [Roseisalinus antarcticus]SLN62743.1 Flagellar biosynthetic protein FlhB [Roseisalinus antarcticus]